LTKQRVLVWRTMLCEIRFHGQRDWSLMEKKLTVVKAEPTDAIG
jgi:hypothetical protein